MSLEENRFKNSEACEGVAYSDKSAPVDMAVIDITGRYPEKGWAVNQVVHEIAYVKRGTGNLAIKGRGVTKLEESFVVLIEPGERYAWEGDMTIVVACSPPFNPEQHALEEQGEI